MGDFLNIAGIVAIITGLLSLIGIAIGQLVIIRENRIKRYVEIITKQTLKNNLFVRENSQVLMMLTRTEIIDDAKEHRDKKYKTNLMRQRLI